jgi:hypothetical protein
MGENINIKEEKMEKGNQLCFLQNASRDETYSAISLGLPKKKKRPEK